MKSQHKRRNLKKNLKLPLKNTSKSTWLKGGLIGLIYGLLLSVLVINSNLSWYSFSEVISIYTRLFLIFVLASGLIGIGLGSLYPKIKNKPIRIIIEIIIALIMIYLAYVNTYLFIMS
jgi:uncharacterized membrane protein YesL